MDTYTYFKQSLRNASEEKFKSSQRRMNKGCVKDDLHKKRVNTDMTADRGDGKREENTIYRSHIVR